MHGSDTMDTDASFDFMRICMAIIMGHARVTRHAHTVLTRGLDWLSYSCSIIAPRIYSCRSCPHFCLHGEMSKRQVTLFGTVAKKGRFFSRSAAGITPYHQVVEKLFELDNGERSRQESSMGAGTMEGSLQGRHEEKRGVVGGLQGLKCFSIRSNHSGRATSRVLFPCHSG